MVPIADIFNHRTNGEHMHVEGTSTNSGSDVDEDDIDVEVIFENESESHHVHLYMMPTTISSDKKRNILGKGAIIRLGLMQGAPISQILFIIYTDDLSKYGSRTLERKVQVSTFRDAALSLTADDVSLHTRNFKRLQHLLNACHM